MSRYGDKIRNLKDYVGLPFVFNHWYVAGYADEFGRAPKARTLLGRSVVFYRSESGTLNALQNRCLHRSFPLSEGYLEGDVLVCRYHGIRYGPDGSVVRIPCQRQTPDKKLHAYPVRQIGPFVFIWMGEAAADIAKLPKLAFLDDPSFRTIHGAMPLEGNYLLMQENLNDLTHFAYLHKDTFPFGEAYLDLPTEVTQTPEGVLCKRTQVDAQSILLALPSDLQMQLAGKPVSQWDGGMMISPGVFFGQAPITVGEADAADREILQQYIMHFITPETETTSHYWWSISNNFGLDADDFYAALEKMVIVGFDEDKWAMQKLQRLLDSDEIGSDDLIIAGDQAGLLCRRVMADWVKAEYGDGPLASPV